MKEKKKRVVYFVCHQMDQIYALFFFHRGFRREKKKILFIDSMLFITMLYNMYINDADKQITMYWVCNVTKSSVCALLGFSFAFLL